VQLDQTRIDPAAAGLDNSRLGRIEAALAAEIRAGRLPGAVIAVARRGHLAYLGAVGTRDPSTGAAMTTDSIFSIASMTKPMTSVAIMQLFEQGRILLGDPVSAYLPAFADLKLGAIAPDGGLTRTALSRPPTVQDLLRHTSGLTYQNRGTTPMHKAYPGSSTSAALSLTRAQAIEALAACPLLFEPGTSWEYGFSTDVLGFIVEEVTGQSLGAYMAENIWSPVGMVDTAFDLSDATRPRYARPLPKDPVSGQPQTLYHERDGEKHWESGGGGAVSTAMDYLRFAEALRTSGKRRPHRRHDGPCRGRLRLRPWFRRAPHQRHLGDVRHQGRLLLVRRVRHLLLDRSLGRADLRRHGSMPRRNAPPLPPVGPRAGLPGGRRVRPYWSGKRRRYCRVLLKLQRLN